MTFRHDEASREPRGAQQKPRQGKDGTRHARTDGSDGGLGLDAFGPPERAERRSGESGDGRGSRGAEHNSAELALVNPTRVLKIDARSTRETRSGARAFLPGARRGGLWRRTRALFPRDVPWAPRLRGRFAKSAHNNERDLFLENPVWEKLTARADHLYRHRARQKRRSLRSETFLGDDRGEPPSFLATRAARRDPTFVSPLTMRHARDVAIGGRPRRARGTPVAPTLLVTLALSALMGVPVNGQNGTYVDVTPTVTEQVSDRFGTQPSHRSGHTMVRAPPRDPKRPRPPALLRAHPPTPTITNLFSARRRAPRRGRVPPPLMPSPNTHRVPPKTRPADTRGRHDRRRFRRSDP